MLDGNDRAPSANERPLRTLLDEPLPVGVALNLAIQVGQALATRHQAGAAYGRLQTETILLDETGHIRLAKDGADQMPAYLSPEQIAGQPAGPASDVYALGCILYEMLTGQPPFPQDAAESAPPPLPHQRNPAIPIKVERVVLRALVQEPQGRFQDAGEMVEALRHCRPGWARRPLALWDRVAPGLEATIGLRRLAFAAAGVAVLVLGLGLGLWALDHGRSDPPEADESQQIAALLDRARQQLAAGTWDQAATTCRQVLELDPGHRTALDCVAWASKEQAADDSFDRAEALLQEARWQQAIEELERLRQTQLGYPGVDDKLCQAHREYGQQLAQEGEPALALAHFDAALALQPGDLAIRRERHWASLYVEGCAEIDRGNWLPAASSLQELYEGDPGYQPDVAQLLYTAYLEQGRVLEDQEQWCAAWQAYDQACQVAEADTREAQSRRGTVEVHCWPPTSTPAPTSTPTSTPTPAPSPTPAPTPTPTPKPRRVRYCYVGEFQGTAEIAFPLISIAGKVLDRRGRGVAGVVVRIGAYNWHHDVLTGQDGGFRLDGLSQPLEWTVSLPEYDASVQVPITSGGQMGLVEFVEKRCP